MPATAWKCTVIGPRGSLNDGTKYKESVDAAARPHRTHPAHDYLSSAGTLRELPLTSGGRDAVRTHARDD
jgi:hypothetical protein